jgi:hypothetical protein
MNVADRGRWRTSSGVAALLALSSWVSVAKADLIEPISLAERDAAYADHFPVSPTYEFLRTLDPTAGFEVFDDRDPRNMGAGSLQDAAMDFQISSVSQNAPATLRLFISEALLNQRSDLQYNLPLSVSIYNGSGVVTLADFPPLGGGWGQYTIPVGNYTAAPYELDMDVSGLVSDLQGRGSDFLAVYINTLVPLDALTEPRFQFSEAVLDATLTPTPEPSSIAIASFGSVLLVGYGRRFRVKHR